MMDWKRLGALLVVLGVLAGLGAWLAGLERLRSPAVTVTALGPSDLAMDALSAIELSVGQSGAPQVRLVRDPAKGWRVATDFDAPADPERVRRLVEAVRGLTGEERAQGTTWFQDFGVGDQGVRIRMLQGDQAIADLVAGRGRRDTAANFVRRGDGEVVCAVDRELLGQVGFWGKVSAAALMSKDWVDLRVFPINLAAIRDVELAERVKESWVVRGERHQPFDASAQHLVGLLTATQASDVVDPAAGRQALKAARWRWIVVQQGDARMEVEEASAQDQADTIAVRRDSDGPYFSVPATALHAVRQQLLPPTVTASAAAVPQPTSKGSRPPTARPRR